MTRTQFIAMTRKSLFPMIGALLIGLGTFAQSGSAADIVAADKSAAPHAVDFFQAIDEHQVDVKFIAKNDHDARILIKNNTQQPVHLKLPEAFAGVPVLAQFGGGGGGRGGGGGGFGGGGRGGGGTSGGGQQSVGGGLGGGGGGGLGGGGGGGGLFSVPPEETAKIDVAVVCLDHGLRTPNGSAAYKIVPADEFLDERPAVVELLKAFGRGDLEHGAVQAAAWHLNSGLTWEQLAAKLDGTRRSARRAPYFSAGEIRAGIDYATEAVRLAEENADQYANDRKARAEKADMDQLESSEARSTTNADSNEPANDTKTNSEELSDTAE